MFKVLLPLPAFVVVLVGLIAVEPPPTPEELAQQERREKLSQIQTEHDKLIEQLDKWERE